MKWLLLILQLCCVSAHAQEKMGLLSLGDFLLSPKMAVQEPSTGGFTLDDSYFSVEWQGSEFLQAYIKVGNSNLVRPAFWYSPIVIQDRLALTEIWGQWMSEYGDVRWGLVPIAIGYESFVGEN